VMAGALIADTGGLLRSLARRPDGRPAWPEHERALRTASRVIVPALVLAEVDYFLRGNRVAMRKLVAEIFDPQTTYEFEPSLPVDIVRALAIDAKFASLELGLVDGMVAAVAERLRVHRVLTIDHADFEPLRVGERFKQRLELVP
jgi:predicted nucleic acid-binding protein